MTEQNETDTQPDEQSSGEDEERTGSNPDAPTEVDETTSEESITAESESADVEPKGDLIEIATLLTTVAEDHDIDLDEQDEVKPESVSVSEELFEQVEESSDRTVARTLAIVSEALSQLDAKRAAQSERAEELESRLRRKQAEFQNYKQRQQKQLQEEKKRATEDLVERLLDVRDNLQRALDQDEDVDIRGGIEATLSQFDSQLERENVERIEPEPGDEVDPTRHEVLATVASDQPESHIAERYRPGYEMAGKVIRTAQVTVSDGSEYDNSGSEPADGNDTESDR